jgi:hypothetical protein
MCRVLTQFFCWECGHITSFVEQAQRISRVPVRRISRRDHQVVDCTCHEVKVLRMSTERSMPCEHCFDLSLRDRATGPLPNDLAEDEMHDLIRARRLWGIKERTLKEALRQLPKRALCLQYHEYWPENEFPILRVVPSNEIPEDRDKCGICWGSLAKFGEHSEGGCDGEIPIMLPCGHIFGKLCLLKGISAEQLSKCPFCTVEFDMTNIRILAANIRDNIFNEDAPNWIPWCVRVMVKHLIAPLFFAVIHSMDVGPGIMRDWRSSLSTAWRVFMALTLICSWPYTIFLCLRFSQYYIGQVAALALLASYIRFIN